MDGGQQRWTSHLGPINIPFYSSSLVGIQPLCSTAFPLPLPDQTLQRALITRLLCLPGASFDSHLSFQILQCPPSGWLLQKSMDRKMRMNGCNIPKTATKAKLENDYLKREWRMLTQTMLSRLFGLNTIMLTVLHFLGSLCLETIPKVSHFLTSFCSFFPQNLIILYFWKKKFNQVLGMAIFFCSKSSSLMRCSQVAKYLQSNPTCHSVPCRVRIQ